MKGTWIISLTTLILMGCTEQRVEVEPLLRIESGKVFALHVGEQAIMPDERFLRFVNVVEDTRCPEDIECEWEGNAVVAFALADRNDASDTGEIFTLNTYGPLGQSVVKHGDTITLHNLHPIPQSDKLITPDEYVVELRVTR